MCLAAVVTCFKFDLHGPLGFSCRHQFWFQVLVRGTSTFDFFDLRMNTKVPASVPASVVPEFQRQVWDFGGVPPPLGTRSTRLCAAASLGAFESGCSSELPHSGRSYADGSGGVLRSKEGCCNNDQMLCFSRLPQSWAWFTLDAFQRRGTAPFRHNAANTD